MTGQHEGILDVARFDPAYVVQLLRLAGMAYDPAQLCSAGGVSENANRRVPFERRIDFVARLVLPEGPLIVPVEAHRRNKQNPAKLIERVRPRWAADFGVLYEMHRCPVILLVISDCDEVAAEARKPIDLGPGSTVRPVSVGPSQVRPITDPDDPAADAGSVMLSALLHGSGPNREAVLTTLNDFLSRIKEEEASRRLYAVLKALQGEPAKILETIMAKTPYKYHSVWADSLRDEGREEGELVEAREAVLDILAARSLEPTAEQRELVKTCTDHDRLRSWRRTAIVAASSDEVFG
ncbi:hypothetical protein [Glycomyces arizonensis]|uniref:hypothetical protein n=1 Tax=Glycomyces arizonensis TaxID=256035 RepID=UPI00047B7814|nr:hypothetical protein [Glycomyces arizonensis]